ncbi:unnamed protein product [Schistosoma mattheei]|uniref:Uncharacterized protein n=1 Tax=Schistosoma mattheei TaxID=31246 RepID=A0A183PWT0_9TREM|nr:unnamed protein product [Schistosoma mattheei]
MESFMYLGNIIDERGGSDVDVKVRIGKASAAFLQLDNIWNSKQLSTNIKAVWAGWGHASENPQLPDVLSKHNIAFLGPSHQAMWTLGDKVASTILAQSADVPTLPWSGSGESRI